MTPIDARLCLSKTGSRPLRVGVVGSTTVTETDTQYDVGPLMDVHSTKPRDPVIRHCRVTQGWAVGVPTLELETQYTKIDAEGTGSEEMGRSTPRSEIHHQTFRKSERWRSKNTRGLSRGRHKYTHMYIHICISTYTCIHRCLVINSNLFLYLLVYDRTSVPKGPQHYCSYLSPSSLTLLGSLFLLKKIFVYYIYNTMVSTFYCIRTLIFTYVILSSFRPSQSYQGVVLKTSTPMRPSGVPLSEDGQC